MLNLSTKHFCITRDSVCPKVNGNGNLHTRSILSPRCSQICHIIVCVCARAPSQSSRTAFLKSATLLSFYVALAQFPTNAPPSFFSPPCSPFLLLSSCFPPSQHSKVVTHIEAAKGNLCNLNSSILSR